MREPLQVVHREVRLPWSNEDWRGASREEQDRRWTAALKNDREQPLSLTDAPVMRFALVRLADETWKFLWSVPALLLDGWSWPLVFRDASRLYEAYAKNAAPQLEPARPYRDYLEWLGQQTTAEATKFWQEQLSGFRKPTALPGDAPGRDAGEFGDGRYQQHVVQLSSDTTNALQAAARRLQVTLNTLVQGAWSILLSRQSGDTDVVFGAAFSGRPTDLPGVESIVGPFTNNLPVRVAVNAEETAGEFFRKVHERLLQLSTYQFTPLMEIQRVSEVPWRYRLFDSLIVFQNYLVDESARRLGGAVDIADFAGPVHSNYPVLLLAEPGTGLRLTLVYDRKTVARSTMERWGRDLEILLELAPVFFDKRVGELQNLLSATCGAERPARSGASSANAEFHARADGDGEEHRVGLAEDVRPGAGECGGQLFRLGRTFVVAGADAQLAAGKIKFGVSDCGAFRASNCKGSGATSGAARGIRDRQSGADAGPGTETKTGSCGDAGAGKKVSQAGSAASRPKLSLGP